MRQNTEVSLLFLEMDWLSWSMGACRHYAAPACRKVMLAVLPDLAIP